MGLTLRHRNIGPDPKRQLGHHDPSKTLLVNFKPIYLDLLNSELTPQAGGILK